MNRIRVQLFVAAIAAILASRATAQTPVSNGNTLAIFGAGNIGSWTTELTISNPGDTAMAATVQNYPTPIVCIQIQPCTLDYQIPPRGTVVSGRPEGGIGVTYVLSESTVGPQALARVLDASGRSVDLPVFRLATLIELDASELVFPAAQRWSEGTVNLQIANIFDAVDPQPEPVTLRLEAFDANGASLGARELTLGGGEHRFLPDVLGFLGVDVVEVGQLSVRRVAGAGRFWGVMPILRADGSLSVSVGAVP
jgi:hypothetical protein